MNIIYIKNITFCFLLWISVSLNSYTEFFKNFHVDFYEGMKNMGIEKSNYTSVWNWNFVQKVYESAAEKLEYTEDLRIPKYIHHVWFGSPLPEYVKHFRKTWTECCKGWTFILWTDNPSPEYGDVILKSFSELESYLRLNNRSSYIVMDMNRFSFFNQKALKQRARNYGEKSDIVRYEILYRFGGLYVDTDFECIRDFEDLHHCFEFYIGIGYDKKFSLQNSIIGAKPYHPVMAEAVMRLRDKLPKDLHTFSYTGPYYLTEVFLSVAQALDERSIVLPVSYFYPMPAVSRGSIDPWIEPETYAVHHWKVSWLRSS